MPCARRVRRGRLRVGRWNATGAAGATWNARQAGSSATAGRRAIPLGGPRTPPGVPASAWSRPTPPAVRPRGMSGLNGRTRPPTQTACRSWGGCRPRLRPRRSGPPHRGFHGIWHRGRGREPGVHAGVCRAARQAVPPAARLVHRATARVVGLRDPGGRRRRRSHRPTAHLAVLLGPWGHRCEHPLSSTRRHLPILRLPSPCGPRRRLDHCLGTPGPRSPGVPPPTGPTSGGPAGQASVLADAR